MTWVKHPGIWFTLYAFETMFWIFLLFSVLNINQVIENCIKFYWNALMLWGIIHYHSRWVEKVMEKLNK